MLSRAYLRGALRLSCVRVGLDSVCEDVGHRASALRQVPHSWAPTPYLLYASPPPPFLSPQLTFLNLLSSSPLSP